MGKFSLKVGMAGTFVSRFAAFVLTMGCAAMMGQAAPAMVPTSVTAGYIDPAGKVPTINGVPGSGVSNLDVSFPVGLLVHGNNYVYSVTGQDNNYTGSCEVGFTLTQVQNGKSVTLDSGLITTFTTAPGNVWLWVITGKAIPDSPGAATLTGIFKCGTNTNTIKTAVLLQ